MTFGKGILERLYRLGRWDAHTCEGVMPEGLDKEADAKSQIHGKVSMGKSKDKLQNVQ
jgi:hypothetical protein